MNIYKRTINGIEFNCRQDTWDENIVHEVFAESAYSFDGLKFSEKPIIFDVGGHIGGFTKRALQAQPNAVVFTFEANPLNYEIIQMNLDKEIQGDDVRLYTAALVGEKPKDSRMYIGKRASFNTGGYSINLNPDSEGLESDTLVSTEPVMNFVTIQDVFNEYCIPEIDFMKLDCEGSEFNILWNMPDEIMTRIKAIGIEWHEQGWLNLGITLKDFLDKLNKYFYINVKEDTNFRSLPKYVWKNKAFYDEGE